MSKSKIFKNHIKILLSEQLRKKKDPTKEAVISQELSLTQKCQKFPKNINYAISKQYEKHIFAIKTAKFNFLGKHNLVFQKKIIPFQNFFFIHKKKLLTKHLLPFLNKVNSRHLFIYLLYFQKLVSFSFLFIPEKIKTIS